MLEDCVFCNFELLPILPFLGRHSNMQRVLLTVLHLVLFASGQEDLVDSLEADWEDKEWDSREGRFSFPRYLSLHSVRDITECKEKSAKVQNISCIAVELHFIQCPFPNQIQFGLSLSPLDTSAPRRPLSSARMSTGRCVTISPPSGARLSIRSMIFPNQT